MTRLGSLRKTAGLTQQQLAEQIGVSRSVLAMWEIGETVPPTKYLLNLADALGCDVEGLLLLLQNDQEGELTMGGPNFKPDVTKNGLDTYVTKKNGIQERYTHRVMNYQLEKIKELCEATGRRPSEIVNTLLDYALARAQVREIKQVGIVFEEQAEDEQEG